MTNLMDLRICFIAGTLARGGAERQLVQMLHALKNAGVKTRVLSLTQGEALEQEIRALGIDVTWIGRSRWRAIRLLRIVQSLRREPAHIVQSAHFYTNLYVALAGRFLRIPSIGAIRNDLNSELLASGFLGLHQLRLPDQVIVNSQLARERAITNGRKATTVHFVANVVNVNGVRRSSTDASPIKILFAGRLVEQKRADRFLHVLREIADWRPDLNFQGLVAGDGPLRSQLERLANDLDLCPNRVVFFGELPDMKTAYEQSDLLVLTSDWEGTPNVLLEAMGCALPVVATDVGGVADIVEHERTGLLVGAGQTASLAEAIVSLIENPQLREEMGARARSSVLTRYSAEGLSESLMRVYRTRFGPQHGEGVGRKSQLPVSTSH